MEDLRRQAIALYDRFTHGEIDRRDFLERIARLAGGAAAASALVTGIAASPAAAAVTDPADPRLTLARGKLGYDSGLSGYVAALKARARRPAVLVIHENRGLNAHIEDVTRRIALAGFLAIAPDMLSPVGGTPKDEDKARDMIGALDLNDSVARAASLAAGFREARATNGRVGVIGFCWGGAFVNRLAVAMGKGLDAGVAYYGPAPDPAEAARVAAPLLLHYAGLDERVARTGEPWVAALKAAGKPVTAFTYAQVNHAFNNDTSAERFDQAAADLAWRRTIAFLRDRLNS